MRNRVFFGGKIWRDLGISIFEFLLPIFEFYGTYFFEKADGGFFGEFVRISYRVKEFAKFDCRFSIYWILATEGHRERREKEEKTN